MSLRDTKPTKLQEYLSTVYAASERLEVSDRVERPTSASQSRRASAAVVNNRSVGLYHIVSTVAKDQRHEDRSDATSIASDDKFGGSSGGNARSILDMFRSDTERRRTLRKAPLFVPHEQQSAGTSVVPHHHDTTTQWSTTSLAGGGGASRQPTHHTSAAPHMKAPSDLLERNTMLANELHDTRQSLSALFVVFSAERQKCVLQSEAYERSALEEERVTQMRLWSQHLTLLYRLKAKKAILRPSQIYLESLREKDALEIKALRGQITVLASQVASHKSHESSTLGSSFESGRNSEIADVERAEWNELYRNMQECISKQRDEIVERDRRIAALTAGGSVEAPRTPASQHRLLNGGLRASQSVAHLGALSPSDR